MVITGKKPSRVKTIDIRLTEREWVAVLDILCKSTDRRAGLLYQKVGNQVVL